MLQMSKKNICILIQKFELAFRTYRRLLKLIKGFQNLEFKTWIDPGIANKFPFIYYRSLLQRLLPIVSI